MHHAGKIRGLLYGIFKIEFTRILYPKRIYPILKSHYAKGILRRNSFGYVGCAS